MPDTNETTEALEVLPLHRKISGLLEFPEKLFTECRAQFIEIHYKYQS
jgi:hypothetical protein